MLRVSYLFVCWIFGVLAFVNGSCDRHNITAHSFTTLCFRTVSQTYSVFKCDRWPTIGVKARLICREGYEGVQQTVECQSNGEWFPKPKKCAQICGRRTASAHDYSNAPWKTVIYGKNETTGLVRLREAIILNSKLVISAPIYNNFGGGILLVAMGPNDSTHYFEVDQAFISSEGAELTLYSLRRPIRFTERIGPICLPSASHLQGFNQNFFQFCGSIKSSSQSYEPGQSVVLSREMKGEQLSYLHGIFKYSNTATCDQFVSIENHLAWIKATSETVFSEWTAWNSCRVEALENGSVLYSISPRMLSVGAVVENGAHVTYECTEPFNLLGNKTNTCHFGVWENDVPSCIAFCPIDGITGPSFAHKCFERASNSEREIECLPSSLPGTIARNNCRDGFEGPTKITECHPNGQWLPKPSKCQRNCGRKSPEVDISNPWFASIYLVEDHKCSGTIISSTRIITAMQCFWSLTMRQEHELSEFFVVVQPTHAEFNKLGNNAQLFVIDRVTYPQNFVPLGDYRFFGSDIAVITIRGSIQFNNLVKPICLPSAEDEPLRVDSPSEMIGFECELLGLKIASTFRGVSGGHSKHLARWVALNQSFDDDKFYQAYEQTSKYCSAKVGSGLTISQMEDGSPVHYLRGVLSTGPDGHKEYDEYTSGSVFAFTDVRKHLDVIAGLSEVSNSTNHSPVDLDCVADTGDRGRAFNNGREIIRDGDRVPNLTHIKHTCLPGHDGIDLFCFNGKFNRGFIDCSRWSWD